VNGCYDHRVHVCLYRLLSLRRHIFTISEKKLSYHRGTARRFKSVEIVSTAAQLYDKLHSIKLAIGEWCWGSLQVVGNDAMW